MPACVSEMSYYIMFVIALLTGVILILASVYFYDRFKNYRNDSDNITKESLDRSSNVSFLFLFLGLFAVMTLFILFFGFQKRLVGVYTSVHVPDTHSLMSHDVSFDRSRSPGFVST